MFLIILLTLGAGAFITVIGVFSAFMIFSRIEQSVESKQKEQVEAKSPSYTKTVPVSSRVKTMPIVRWMYKTTQNNLINDGNSKGAGWLG